MRLILTVLVWAGLMAALMTALLVGLFVVVGEGIPVGFLLVVAGVSALMGGAAGVARWDEMTRPA